MQARLTPVEAMEESSMENMVRFAIVGTEGIGKSHEKGIRETKEAVLTAVCDVNEDYARRIGADFYGKDAMSAVRYAESVEKLKK